ncbi:RrF2 family transcriptional regulator [Kordiimonas marina]|uniref:RrF2 family transcriptional regulator n=1 Tax=Kordiimonas marina TaxID=2872312 RepID=UPI001FF6A20F|nr:Rrf2 family transcriptional regulator [Kordiimonas marina]MCJ9428623.1 Rrf2 family transcriptional regulator [Kordiimonas marina]
MKLNEGIEWGIHCCGLLATLPEGAALPTTKLAEFFDLPKDYLAKHLQHLSRAGLVNSSRGPGGGYSLARPADKIRLLDIVEAIDGKGPSFRCAEIRRRGPSAVGSECYQKDCCISRAMLRADAAWRQSLASVTLATLCDESKEDMPSEQFQKAQAWIEQEVG